MSTPVSNAQLSGFAADVVTKEDIGTVSRVTGSRAATVLLLLLLSVHWPLLLNDGFYMDDWLNLKARSDFSVDLTYLLEGAGHPIFYLYGVLANASGAPALLLTILELASIAVGANALRSAAVRLGIMSQLEAVAFALIVWAYPGYQVWAGKSNTVYLISFGWFCVGIWFLVLHAQSRWPWRAVFRAAALVTFFICFALNSIMALYLFVALGLFIAEWRRLDPATPTVQRPFVAGIATLRDYGDFIALPIIYWVALQLLFPREGGYLSHYATHAPTWAELSAGLAAFWTFGFRKLYDQVWQFNATDLSILTASAMLTLAVLSLLVNRGPEPRMRLWSVLWPLLLAPVAFVVTAAPYLIAGLTPNPHFYETRHLVLFGVPLALGVLGLARVVGFRSRWGTFAVFALAIPVLTALLISNYAFLQARWLKQASLIYHLKRDWPQPPAQVFNLADGFLDYPAHHVYYGISEVTGALRLAWGPRPFVGFTLRNERPTVLQEIDGAVHAEVSAYRNMDASGPQGTIVLQPGPLAMQNTPLAMRYYTCRLLRVCDVDRLLDGLSKVQITVGPIPTVLPVASR